MLKPHIFKFEHLAKRGQYSPAVECKGTEKLEGRRQVNLFFRIRLISFDKTRSAAARFASQSGSLGLLPQLGHPKF